MLLGKQITLKFLKLFDTINVRYFNDFNKKK